MNIPCAFDRTILSFQGTPVEQERGLIRFVKKNGNVDDTPAELPATLSSLMRDVSNLNITKSALRQFLAAKRNRRERDRGIVG